MSIQTRLWWFVHNVFAHPAMEILRTLGCPRASAWIHDITIPKGKLVTWKVGEFEIDLEPFDGD